MDEKETLPKTFVLQPLLSNNYVRYVHDDKKIHGFLQSSGNHVMNPYSKFEVQGAKTGNGLVHIRCNYNNKYWVIPSPSSRFVVASASEAEEDRSKDSCTLFEPIYYPNMEAFRFRHVRLDRFLGLHSKDDEHFKCLFANTSVPKSDTSDAFVAVAWDTITVLPRFIAFKGNNDKCLRAHDQSGDTLLQFSASDVGDPRARNEVFMTADGHVRILNHHSQKFWINDGNWIYAKATKTETDDPNTLFWPIKLDHKSVALRNKRNDLFCKRLTADRKENCLNAGSNYITGEAKLEITELVLSREIYNVDFDMSDARVNKEKPMVMTSGVVENQNTVPEKLSLKLSYEYTHTTTWSSSVSMKLGAKMSFSSGIPKITEGKITISAEISGEYEWGGKQESKSLVEVVHDIVVPPSTRIKASIVASQGECDIPFSYTQRDILTDGKVIYRHYDDGICTTMNSYNYQFVTEEEVL